MLSLPQTAEYALRAVIWLGQHPGDPQTTQQIATGCQMPASYLAKVLQPLARAGIVSSQRGLGGGYVLEHNVDELTLLQIVNAVEPVQRSVRPAVQPLDTCGDGRGSRGSAVAVSRRHVFVPPVSSR